MAESPRTQPATDAEIQRLRAGLIAYIKAHGGHPTSRTTFEVENRTGDYDWVPGLIGMFRYVFPTLEAAQGYISLFREYMEAWDSTTVHDTTPREYRIKKRCAEITYIDAD